MKRIRERKRDRKREMHVETVGRHRVPINKVYEFRYIRIKATQRAQPWSTLVAGDEQAHQLRGKST